MGSQPDGRLVSILLLIIGCAVAGALSNVEGPSRSAGTEDAATPATRKANPRSPPQEAADDASSPPSTETVKRTSKKPRKLRPARFTTAVDELGYPAPAPLRYEDVMQRLPSPPSPPGRGGGASEEGSETPSRGKGAGPAPKQVLSYDGVTDGAATQQFLHRIASLTTAKVRAWDADYFQLLDAMNRSTRGRGGEPTAASDIYPGTYDEWLSPAANNGAAVFARDHEALLRRLPPPPPRETSDRYKELPRFATVFDCSFAGGPPCVWPFIGSATGRLVGFRIQAAERTFGPQTRGGSEFEIRASDARTFQALLDERGHRAASWLQVRALTSLHEEVAFVFIPANQKVVTATLEATTTVADALSSIMPLVLIDEAAMAGVGGVPRTPEAFRVDDKNPLRFVGPDSKYRTIDGDDHAPRPLDTSAVTLGIYRLVSPPRRLGMGSSDSAAVGDESEMSMPVVEVQVSPMCINSAAVGPLTPSELTDRIVTWVNQATAPYIAELREPRRFLLHRDVQGTKSRPDSVDRRRYVEGSARVSIVLPASDEDMSYIEDLRRWAIGPDREPTCLSILREASVEARHRMRVEGDVEGADIEADTLQLDALYFDAAAHYQMAEWVAAWPHWGSSQSVTAPRCSFGVMTRLLPPVEGVTHVVRRLRCDVRNAAELLTCASAVLEFSRSWRRWKASNVGSIGEERLGRVLAGNLDRLRGGLTADASLWQRVTTGIRTLIGTTGSVLGFVLGPNDVCAACIAFRTHDFPKIARAKLQNAMGIDAKLLLLSLGDTPSLSVADEVAKPHWSDALLKLLVDDGVASEVPFTFYANFSHIVVETRVRSRRSVQQEVLQFARSNGLVPAAEANEGAEPREGHEGSSDSAGAEAFQPRRLRTRQAYFARRQQQQQKP